MEGRGGRMPRCLDQLFLLDVIWERVVQSEYRNPHLHTPAVHCVLCAYNMLCIINNIDLYLSFSLYIYTGIPA